MEVDEVMPWVCLLNGKTPALKTIQGLSSPLLEKRGAELVLCCWPQHGLREERVVGPGGDDSDGHLELLLPTATAVDDVDPRRVFR